MQTCTARCIVVEANAGTGKTTTLALRAAESLRRGLAPREIVAFTFTSTASQALATAFRRQDLPAGVDISTIDAFACRILREVYGKDVPLVADAEALAPHVWEAVREVEQRNQQRQGQALELPSWGDASWVDEFLRVNARLKGTLRDHLDGPENRFDAEYAHDIGVDYSVLSVFRAYERMRRQNLAASPRFWGPFDATYDLACEISRGEDVRTAAAWPAWARAVLVDEMHDLNEAAFRVLKHVLEAGNSFFCGVGDVDQVIHENTGAEARFMQHEVDRQFPGRTQRCKLTASFRAAPSLTDLAGRVAGKAYSSAATHTTTVLERTYADSADCVSQVLDDVLAWKSSKRNLNDLAVLLRHPHQSIAIENALLAEGIPYQMQGFESYLRRPEVLFIRGLLAVATGKVEGIVSDESRLDIMRALLLFARSRIEVAGREADTQEQLLASAARMLKELPNFLADGFFDNHVLKNADPHIRAKLVGAVELCRREHGSPLVEIFASLKMDAILAQVFMTRQRRTQASANLAGLLGAATGTETPVAFFQRLNEAERRQSRAPTPGKVRKEPALWLASVVHVKGLQFEGVLMPFLENGIFPSDDSDARAERNKFYVGMTRARSQLALYRSASAPSSFLPGAPKRAGG